jgi:hypothetical protein
MPKSTITTVSAEEASGLRPGGLMDADRTADMRLDQQQNAYPGELTMTGQLLTLFRDSVTAAAGASLLYAAALFAATLFALAARRPGRRRDARKVLALLLHRDTDNIDGTSGKPGPCRHPPGQQPDRG